MAKHPVTFFTRFFGAFEVVLEIQVKAFGVAKLERLVILKGGLEFVRNIGYVELDAAGYFGEEVDGVARAGLGFFVVFLHGDPRIEREVVHPFLISLVLLS